MFPEETVSLYIDGNIQLRKSVRAYIAAYAGEHPMICQRHPERTCIYEEAGVVLSMHLDDSDLVRDQMRRYHLEGFPPNFGLTCSNVMARVHNDPAVIAVMEDWWKEVRDGSRRDQLSFSYCIWKNGFTYDKTDLFSHGNIYFGTIQHRGKRADARKPSQRGLRGFLNAVYGAVCNDIKQ